MVAWLRRLGRTGRRSLAAVILLALICMLIWPTQRAEQQDKNAEVSQRLKTISGNPNCTSSGTVTGDDIVVVLKTGTTEVDTKLPTQLRTVFACIPNVLVLSDLDGEVEGQPVYDALAGVNKTLRDTDPTFELYRLQQRMRREGNSLKKIATLITMDDSSTNAAWMLDRYKFLHMLEKAWTLAPQKAWYVFVEADTYMFWRNLVTWLTKNDPGVAQYLGVSETIGSMAFAYGGSGIVLSRAAMQGINVHNPGLATRWDKRLSTECCGDYVLSLALAPLDLNVTDAWPILSKEPPLHIPYGPSAWCEPVATLHHVSPQDVEALWDFEKQHVEWSTDPPLFRDLFHRFIPDGLPSLRENWDNSCSGDAFKIIAGLPKATGGSLAACSEVCDSLPQCFQFLYREPACKLYSCFTYGKAAAAYRGKSWISGWKQDRIAKWIADHSDCLQR